MVFGKEGNRLLVVASAPPLSLTLVVPAEPVVEVGLSGTGTIGTAPDVSTSKLELISPTAEETGLVVGTLEVVPTFPPVEVCADAVFAV